MGIRVARRGTGLSSREGVIREAPAGAGQPGKDL
jgi:hypothetical protein